MKIAVARETREGETRVAMVPELVGKLTELGYDVAGRARRRAARRCSTTTRSTSRPARPSTDDALADADVVVSVQPLPADRVRRLRDGAADGLLPAGQPSSTTSSPTCATCGITAFAMELVPRISRAQSMDALSSQALVAGYRCAIVAAGLLRRFFPLNMTAAGTVPARRGRGARRRRRRAAGDRDVQAARRGRPGLRRARRRRRGDPLDGREVDRPRARDARGLGRLRPRDDRGPRRPAARAARRRTSPPRTR